MARIVNSLARSLLPLLLVGLLPGAARGAGFLLFEQTGRGLGSAYAGEGAVAMDPTTVYFNPAGMTLLEGTQFAGSGFAVWTRTHFENRGSHLSDAIGGAPLTGGAGGNGGEIALLPTFFLTHKLTDRVSLGLGLSTPFGLETDWPRDWVGRYHARLSRLQTINLNPSVAFEVTDWFSLGGGADIEWARANLANNIDLGAVCQEQGARVGITPAVCNALGLPPQKQNGYVRLRGDDWAPGFNVGMLFKPLPRTRIGLSYRSRIVHDLSGDADFRIPKKADVLLKAQPGALVDQHVEASATLPDRVSLSLFSQITDQWAFLADATWTHWSLFNALVFHFANPGQPTITEPEDWHNSTRYSMGLVYKIGRASCRERV